MKKQIFKVGDRVYYIDYGFGVIDDISNSKTDLHPFKTDSGYCGEMKRIKILD